MDEFNEIFKLAAELVNNTPKSLFLTGKAGTGKTTFLRYIKEHSSKNLVVAAPTGVAAINAGGTTIHSLFQLPFEPFVPDAAGEGVQKLFHHLKLHKNKIDMFRELELLIIDEVSMLRADIMDAIDVSLQRFRRNSKPFGGVQVLLIGDMFQLPPVAQSEEWDLLKDYYKTPFFFHSKVITKSPPLYIELKKIYRQNEQYFIDLLNKIRNNDITSDELEILNEKYNPDFVVPKDENYVVLSTHNYKADRINFAELDKLPGKEYKFTGKVKGNFLETSFPTDLDLRLKKGAQVMFVKNDSERRYYNGKLGVITNLEDDKIHVSLTGSGTEIELMPEMWKNVRYTLNKETNMIEEDELGSFTQFPIRLAWAITIHKSQGLTFERAVIDAGQAFAAGQVYVALSRCTTLDGIVLHSKITPGSIKTNPEIIEFAKQERPIDELTRILAVERPKYLREKLIHAFDWQQALDLSMSFTSLTLEKTIPDSAEAFAMALNIQNRMSEQQKVAKKFQEQLHLLLNNFEKDGDILTLKNRVQKAVIYFYKDFTENVLNPLDAHLDSLKKASKVKQYTTAVRDIKSGLEEFIVKLKRVAYGEILLTEEIDFETIAPQTNKPSDSKRSKPEKEKGASFFITLEMFRKGMDMEDIAVERNLAQSTIEGHLTAFVKTGEILIHELMSEEKVKIIQPLVENFNEQSSLSEIKQKLGDEFSYGDIKAVINHLTYLSKS